MLKVELVEVLQVGEGWFHYLVESSRIFKEARTNKHLRFSGEFQYRNAPGCKSCDMDDLSVVAPMYSALLPAHEQAIRIAALSPRRADTTKDHSPGLIIFLRRKLVDCCLSRRIWRPPQALPPCRRKSPPIRSFKRVQRSRCSSIDMSASRPRGSGASNTMGPRVSFAAFRSVIDTDQKPTGSSTSTTSRHLLISGRGQLILFAIFVLCARIAMRSFT